MFSAVLLGVALGGESRHLLSSYLYGASRPINVLIYVTVCMYIFTIFIGFLQSVPYNGNKYIIPALTGARCTWFSYSGSFAVFKNYVRVPVLLYVPSFPCRM